MSASEDQSGDEDDPAPALLRWADSATSVSHEESVELIEARLLEATVASSVELARHTPVDLVAADLIEKGTVTSCRADGERYVLTISLNPEPRNPLFALERDPGIFAVDDFLTEEQEERILREIEQEIAGSPKTAKAAVGRIRNV